MRVRVRGKERSKRMRVANEHCQRGCHSDPCPWRYSLTLTSQYAYGSTLSSVYWATLTGLHSTVAQSHEFTFNLWHDRHPRATEKRMEQLVLVLHCLSACLSCSVCLSVSFIHWLTSHWPSRLLASFTALLFDIKREQKMTIFWHQEMKFIAPVLVMSALLKRIRFAMNGQWPKAMITIIIDNSRDKRAEEAEWESAREWSETKQKQITDKWLDIQSRSKKSSNARVKGKGRSLARRSTFLRTLKVNSSWHRLPSILSPVVWKHLRGQVNAP